MEERRKRLREGQARRARRGSRRKQENVGHTLSSVRHSTTFQAGRRKYEYRPATLKEWKQAGALGLGILGVVLMLLVGSALGGIFVVIGLLGMVLAPIYYFFKGNG